MSKRDEELNAMHELGRVGALEQLWPEFAKRAGEAYAKGRDEMASLYRSLSVEFKAKAEIARREWTEKYRPERAAKRNP